MEALEAGATGSSELRMCQDVFAVGWECTMATDEVVTIAEASSNMIRVDV